MKSTPGDQECMWQSSRLEFRPLGCGLNVNEKRQRDLKELTKCGRSCFQIETEFEKVEKTAEI